MNKNENLEFIVTRDKMARAGQIAGYVIGAVTGYIGGEPSDIMHGGGNGLIYGTVAGFMLGQIIEAGYKLGSKIKTSYDKKNDN